MKKVQIEANNKLGIQNGDKHQFYNQIIHNVNIFDKSFCFLKFFIHIYFPEMFYKERLSPYHGTVSYAGEELDATLEPFKLPENGE